MSEEAMRDALMIELAFCLHNDLTVSETTGRVCAVIAAAMAADKAEIVRLEGALRRIEGVYRHSREDAAENAYEMQSIATAALEAKE